MNQKGSINITLIVLAVVLAGAVGAAGYFYFARYPARQVPIYQAPTPAPDAEQPDVPQPAAPRVISCNPRKYSDAFERLRPCVSDMTAVDIERENKALAIIDKAIGARPRIAIPMGQLRAIHGDRLHLYVSDARYQLIRTGFDPGIGGYGYVVVDTVGEKITDEWMRFSLVDKLPKILLFTDGSSVKQYAFGREKPIILPESTLLVRSETYDCYEGPVGVIGVRVLALTPNSISLAICDPNKPKPLPPGEDTREFEQVGTRIINLAD
jgi:hypothetical protein